MSNFDNNQSLKTIYLKAAALNRNTIVALLILGGADLETKNDDDVTSLMLGKIFIFSKISYYIIINKSS
jgi:ankyrin repeat protein